LEEVKRKGGLGEGKGMGDGEEVGVEGPRGRRGESKRGGTNR